MMTCRSCSSATGNWCRNHHRRRQRFASGSIKASTARLDCANDLSLRPARSSLYARSRASPRRRSSANRELFGSVAESVDATQSYFSRTRQGLVSPGITPASFSTISAGYGTGAFHHPDALLARHSAPHTEFAADTLSSGRAQAPVHASGIPMVYWLSSPQGRA